jgi:hypothetical protein
MGLSTDSKPAAAIGSRFIETDTGNIFLQYNTGTWTLIGPVTGPGSVFAATYFGAV